MVSQRVFNCLIDKLLLSVLLLFILVFFRFFLRFLLLVVFGFFVFIICNCLLLVVNFVWKELGELLNRWVAGAQLQQLLLYVLCSDEVLRL